jgi:hypothetical protein
MFATVITDPPLSKERQPLSQHIPMEYADSVVVLNAGVMRGFERVVALPDPKDIEFPQPPQLFR